MALHRFHKMHGLGNDFVIFDTRETSLSLTTAQVIALADRQRGIGCDQLILIKPSQHADIAMQIFNQDGSEVGACGNASRCVVALIGHDCTIETAGGLLMGKISDEQVTVDMGLPHFDWQDIPLAYAMDTASLPLAWEDLGQPMAISMGNPHAVFFVADSDAIDLERLGPVIEHDPVFPARVNVNIASPIVDGLKLRVWERGAGLTLACGTGACATAVAAIRQKKAQSPVRIHLPGGVLTIAWTPGETVKMTGPVTQVFEGTIDL